jgi:exoribonuclease-2
VRNFKEIDTYSVLPDTIREIWEMLLDDASAPVTLKALCEFFGEYSVSAAWFVFCLLKEAVFYGDINAIFPRSKEELHPLKQSAVNKEKETGECSFFLERLKRCLKSPEQNSLLPEDTRFFQDVEALAYGKTLKSRTMKISQRADMIQTAPLIKPDGNTLGIK